jgi:hypothetical protein
MYAVKPIIQFRKKIEVAATTGYHEDNMSNMEANMRVFENRDVFRNKNFVEPLGFSRDLTLDEMLIIARQHGATGLVKNGAGKWYLRNQPREELLARLTSPTIRDYERRTFYLL